MLLNRDDPKPLHVQLEDILRELIHDEWSKTPNYMIPSENELCKQYGLSRMTVRSVVTNLAKEGLLYRVQGKGTFVSDKKISTRSLAYMGIREQLEIMGYETSTKLIKFNCIIPNSKVRQILDLPIGEKVYEIERVRSIKNQPLSLHLTYLPYSLCPNLDSSYLETEQLCVILKNDYQLSASKVIETLESTAANVYEAQVLSLKQNYPLLMLEDIIYCDKIVFEYSKVLYRGDKIKLHFEY